MAAQWYYLDNGNKSGPVTGKGLKQLADTGVVLPSTPVRRVMGDDQTPWTRAGAIKELFPGNVEHQLGPPICDDCGGVKVGGDCLACNPAVSFAPPIEPPAPPVEPPVEPPPIVTEERAATSDDMPMGSYAVASQLPVPQKFPNLRKYVGILKTLAWVIMALSWLFAFASIVGAVVKLITESGGLGDVFMGGFGAVLSLSMGYLYYVLVMALAEMIIVGLDIEQNTRQTAVNTQPR